MNGFAIDDWHDFLTAEAGAGAALTGLVFVAISINLSAVVRDHAVAGRAFEALALLLSLLLASLFALMPGQGLVALGIELLVLGSMLWGGVSHVAFAKDSTGHATMVQWRLRQALGQAATLTLAIAGASLIAHWGGGLYWLAASAVLGVIAGMIGAWVLLVEILR